MAEELVLPSRYTRNPDGTLGVIEDEPIDNRFEVTVLPADDPKKLRLGWTITEEIGIVIINDYAISAIVTEESVEEVIPIPEIIDIDMSHLFDDIGNRFSLMDI